MSLPTPRQYEARYELRLRDFRKNVDNPEAVLNGMELMDSRQLVDALCCQYNQEGTSIRLDNSQKITIRVHDSQPDEALCRAQIIFQHLLDTVYDFGEQMCHAKSAEYQRQIEQLGQLPVSDSTASLLCQFQDRLAILQADDQGGIRYVDLYCSPEQGNIQMTPNRPLVIAISVVVAALFYILLTYYRRKYGAKAD